MELVNNEKALYTAFLCVGYGLLCGGILTLFTLCFPKATATRLRTALRDGLFLLFCAVGLFLLSLPLTDGRPRFWLFLGTAAGFFAWNRLFERPFCRLWRAFVTPISRAYDTIGRVLVTVGVKWRKKVKKSEIFFKNLLKFKKKLLYNKRK